MLLILPLYFIFLGPLVFLCVHPIVFNIFSNYFNLQIFKLGLFLYSYTADYKATLMCSVCSCAFHSLLQTGTDRENHSSSAAHALIYSCRNGNDGGLVCCSDNQGPIQFSCGSLHWYWEVILDIFFLRNLI